MPTPQHSDRRSTSIARSLKGLRLLFRRERGVSAVEFSLLAPFMVFGGIATVDTGMAVYEKMMISQVLRSGAQSAIGAKNQTVIGDILQATASQNFSLAGDNPTPDQLQISVTSYCICPENTAAQVPCTDFCASFATPNQFYSLSATKVFDGVILPDITLAGSIDVMAN